MLVVATLLTSLCMFATGASAAADVWDGKSANIKWYTDNPSATEFTVDTAAELYGLSVFLSFKEPAVAVVDAGKVYYDANGDIILDATKVTADTASVPFEQFINKTIKLGADIDLNNKPFLPIGSSGSFQGMFDGQNHTISNVVINQNEADHKGTAYTGKQAYYGLFAFIAKDGSGVKNLTVKNEVINIKITPTVQKIWAGGITGTTLNNVELTNVKIEGLTINFTIDGGVPTHKLEIYYGASCGVYKSNKAFTNVVITDYLETGVEALTTAMAGNTAGFVFRGDDDFCGFNTTSAALTGSSVTVKAPDSGDNNNGNTGSNPETGDMTALVAVVAVMTLALGAVVVAKKRAHR